MLLRTLILLLGLVIPGWLIYSGGWGLVFGSIMATVLITMYSYNQPTYPRSRRRK